MIHRSLNALPWAGAAPGEPADLPETYGVDVLMLAPVDPSRLFATFQIAWSTRNRLVEELGDERLSQCRMILRLHADDQSGACQEVDVSGPSRSWYVDLEITSRSLWGEIGCLEPEGTFYVVARSGRVDLPWERPSPRFDPEWVPVEEAYERIARSVGMHPETLYCARGCVALAEGRDQRLGRKSLPSAVR